MPRIAVVTPYFREPIELLVQCHQSVIAQEVDAEVVHIMVADGHPRDELDAWKVRHLVLPSSHADCGSTARGLGGLMADTEGFDFVTYLDADNWYHAGHLASLLEAHVRTGAPVCTSFRTFHRPDGSQIEVTEPAEDELMHVDTSCFFVHRDAFDVLPVWLRMPPQAWLLCDRVFLAAFKHHRYTVISTRKRTIAFRTLYEAHYTPAGLPLPVGYKPADVLRPAIEWLSSAQGVTESVGRLGFWPLAYM